MNDTVSTNLADEYTEMLESLGGSTAKETSSSAEDEDSENYSPLHKGAPGISSSIEERALSLLGVGVGTDSVASALGVTAARISQLLAEEHFSSAVSKLRYENLQKHNRRDDKYDTLEDKLLVKLERSLGLMMKPESILKAVAVVNNAKRRGQSAPAQVINNQNIVNLALPKVIVDKFTLNINNQVTKAGDQDLLTMPSGNLLKQVEEASELREERLLEQL